LLNYFGEYYDGQLWETWVAIVIEMRVYFQNDNVGGWSSAYCSKTLNTLTLENDADPDVFNLLFRIDSENKADLSKIFSYLCHDGAFEIIKTYDLSLVDFTRRDYLGTSIFRSLIEKGLMNDKPLKKNHPFFQRLVLRTEKMFFYLISVAEKKLGRDKVDQIIERPDDGGDTVFLTTSRLSEKISSWILDRNIDVAFVNVEWSTPHFFYQSLVEKMLLKEINPFVVDRTRTSWYSESTINFRNINRNKRKREKLLKPFLTGKIASEKTEVYFSFADSRCNQHCEKICKDKMRKFNQQLLNY